MILIDFILCATFSMFKQILEAKGCFNVKKSPDVRESLNNLDNNSKRFIESFGGFRVFLMKCTRFFFDNRNPNVLYLTSRNDDYETCDMVEGPLFDENLNSEMSSLMPQTFLDESLSEDSNDIECESSIKLKENIGKESVIQEKKIDEKTSMQTLDADSAEKEPATIRLPKYRGTDVDKVFKGLREIAEKSGLAEVIDSNEEERTRPRPSKTYKGHETKDYPFRMLLPEYINKHTRMPRKNDPDAQNQRFMFINSSSTESTERKSSVTQALLELKKLKKGINNKQDFANSLQRESKQILKKIHKYHATRKNKTNNSALKAKEKMKRFVESSRDKEVKTSKSKELKEKSFKQKERSGPKLLIESSKEVKISKLGESIEKRSSITQATTAKFTNKKESSEKSAQQKEKNNVKGIIESQSDKTVTVSKLEESVKKKSSITQANPANNDTILGSMQQSTKGTCKSKLLEKQTTVKQNKMKLAADKSLLEEKCLQVFLPSGSSQTRNKISENEKERGPIQKSSKVKDSSKSVVNQDNHIKGTTDNLPLSVVEVGVQVDIYKEEREDYKHKSDVLMSTNKKLIEDVKQGEMYQVKYEEALFEMQKQNAEFNTSAAQYKQDIKELKSIIEVIILRDLLILLSSLFLCPALLKVWHKASSFSASRHPAKRASPQDGQ